MADKNSTLETLEKIKSFAIAGVGAGIFSMGSTYFSEQAEYRIPRILIPVYEIFGNYGLAIGMLILGLILMYFAYKKYTGNQGKPLYLIAFLILAVIGFYAIILSTSTKKTSIEDIKSTIEKSEQTTNTVSIATTRPTIDNANEKNYLEKLEAIEIKYQEAISKKDKALFDSYAKEYLEITRLRGKVLPEIVNNPGYDNFVSYSLEVVERIKKLREQQW
ncbi:MAG: hypothetical protein KA232_10720 [Chryseobacterium sp.]|nr:hypothetical protein [Chryseobacterium sp.]